jgi:hypothetical protein
MPPLTNSRRLAVVGGFLWLALAAILLLLAMVGAILDPDAVVYGALGAAAVGHAAMLFTQAPTRRLLVGSAFVGLLSTLFGLSAAVRSVELLSELTLPYAALSALATVVCATAAVLSSGRR